MSEGNGASRLDRIEKQLEKLGEVVAGLIDHAGMTDNRIEQMRKVQLETSLGVQNLVSAIRGLIDRIPPENLR